MKLHELNHKISCIPKTYGKYATTFSKAILAIYSDDYDQKNYRILENSTSSYTPENLIKYGVKISEYPYNSVGERKYLLFMDEPCVFESMDSLRTFCVSYCVDYLPEGCRPTEFVFKFDIFEHSTYSEFIAMLQAIYPNITPFLAFNDLITSVAASEKMMEIKAPFKKDFHIVDFDERAYRDMNGFYTNSNIREEMYLQHFFANVDLYVKSLPNVKNLLLFNVYNDPNLGINQRHCMTLAYINYKYHIPFYISSRDMLLRVKRYLNLFHMPFDFYAAYDKLMIYREFPTFGMYSREFSDYIIYVPIESRKFSGVITYLTDGEVQTENVNLLSLKIYKTFDAKHLIDKEFETDILELEAAINHRSFLHLGNCLYADISGVKTLCYLESMDVDFLSYCYPSDTEIPAFARTLGAEELSQIIPIIDVVFVETEGGGNVLKTVLQGLMKLVAKKKLSSKPVVKKSIYIADYHTDGIGIVSHEIEAFIKRPTTFQSDLSPEIKDIYSRYNVRFRNNLVSGLVEDIPLDRLRKHSDFLSIYGTTNHILTVKEEFFKS